jgi:hypothetical protein
MIRNLHTSKVINPGKNFSVLAQPLGVCIANACRNVPMNLTQPCKSIGTQISSGDIATEWRFGDTFSGALKTQSRTRAQDALTAECRELPVEIADKSHTFHSQYCKVEYDPI